MKKFGFFGGVGVDRKINRCASEERTDLNEASEEYHALGTAGKNRELV